MCVGEDAANLQKPQESSAPCVHQQQCFFVFFVLSNTSTEQVNVIQHGANHFLSQMKRSDGKRGTHLAAAQRGFEKCHVHTELLHGSRACDALTPPPTPPLPRGEEVSSSLTQRGFLTRAQLENDPGRLTGFTSACIYIFRQMEESGSDGTSVWGESNTWGLIITIASREEPLLMSFSSNAVTIKLRVAEVTGV